MKLRTLLLIFVFSVACNSQKRPDPTDAARLEKILGDQQKRYQRWSQIAREQAEIQAEGESAKKEYDNVQEDAFRRAGVDQKKFNLVRKPDKTWEFVPVPQPAPVKPAAKK